MAEEGTEIYTTNLPYFIWSGWDDVPDKYVKISKPMLIVRRKAKNTRFIAVHQPFDKQAATLNVIIEDDNLNISSDSYTDTVELDLREMILQVKRKV